MSDNKNSRVLSLVFLSVMLFVTFPASAEVGSKEVAKCAVITGDLARLSCYDKLAKDNNLSGKQSTAPAIKGTGKWHVSIDVNPIDDSKSVTLSLNADSGQNKWKKGISLIARCRSNTTEMYINWQDYLGGEARVLTRVGDSKALTSEWSLSTDKKATFRRAPITFLKKMLAANKLIAQVTPYNDNPITVVFDTSGLQNAIKPLRSTCGW